MVFVVAVLAAVLGFVAGFIAARREKAASEPLPCPDCERRSRELAIQAVVSAVVAPTVEQVCAEVVQASRPDRLLVPHGGHARKDRKPILAVAEAYRERADSPFVQCVFDDGGTKITKRLRHANLTDEMQWRGVPYLLTKNGGTIRYYKRKS